MKTFDQEIRQEQAERQERELTESRNRVRRGENIYTYFCVWCDSEGQPKWKNNPYKFGEFLRKNHIEIDFWKRKFIAENHFGYKYNFNHEKLNWEILRKIKK